MDLFYTAEWMARQDQEHTLPVLKILKLHPVQEDPNVFIMTEGDSEKARIDLHDRNQEKFSGLLSAKMGTHSTSMLILKIRKEFN